jgi:hypothetical protein
VLARENFASSLMAAPEMAQSKKLADRRAPGNARRSARLGRTILQGDASASSLAASQGYLDGAAPRPHDALRRKFRRTHARRRVPHDGDARLPTQLEELPEL